MKRALLLLVPAVGISIVWLDRPLATLVDRALASPGLFRWADLFFTLLLVAGGVLIALSFLPAGRALRRPALAGVIGLILSEAIKFLAGRSPVYPTFLVEGVSMLTPFHAGSFPSTTATVSTAVAGVLGTACRRPRPLYAIVLVVVCAFLVVVNAHWLSDVLAGILLGGVTASAILIKPEPPA